MCSSVSWCVVGCGSPVASGRHDAVPWSQCFGCYYVQTTLLPDCPNAVGILGSKATGEPSYSLGCSAHFAVKYAVRAARIDAGASGT